jgi:FkbM family methyltransferase
MARAPLGFDRTTGRLDGASTLERCAALALQAGAKVSSVFDHRGFSIGSRLVTSMLNRREIVLQLNEDARFAFPFGDGYWSLLLDRNFKYEDETERFLKGVAGVDFTFIDCGANFGFWSVLVSSRPFGAHPTIAVEPSSSNLNKLKRNAEINGNRFAILHCAVGAKDGSAVLSGHKHEGMTIVGDGADGGGETVEVIALDSLLDRGQIERGRPLVVKLDVEGVEIEAIEGGRRLFEADTVLIVEEHGSDRNHTVSRYIFDRTPYRMFVFDPQTGGFEPLLELSTLDRIKVYAATGYNVFVTTSAFWEDRIRALPKVAKH